MEAETVPSAPTQPTETAPAAVRETSTPESKNPLDRLTETERVEFNKSGNLPDRVTGKTTQAAQPDEDTAIDAKGAPLKDAQGRFVSKRQQEAERRTRDAVDRATEGTRRENDDLRRRLAALESRAPQPPAQPQQQPAEDREPTLDDFLDQPDPYLSYNRAIAKWETAQVIAAREREYEQQTQIERHQQSVMERVHAHTQREAALRTTVTDYDTRTQGVREALDVRSPLTVAVIESPVSEKLILHLADHPEDFQRLAVLGLHSLPAALREIGNIEAQYKPARSAASGAAAAPPRKLTSTAPEPFTALGTRPAEPADASRAALARKDFSAFRDEEDRKDLARMRRS